MQLQAALVAQYLVLVPKAGESKPAAAWRIWRESRSIVCDVVSAQDPFFFGLLAWRIAKRAGAKLHVQVHTDLRAYSGVRHVLAHIVLRHADAVRVVSSALQKQVEAWGVRAPVHVLPIYIDIEPFVRLGRRAHEGKTVLWVGRFEDEKDPLLAIEVLKKINTQGIDASLVMLGSGSLEPQLRAAASGFPIEFPGWQDTKAYLEAADVCLSTSKHESWGASIVEALAAGVPVVAPDVGVAREAGAVVAARTELADAVVKVLQSAERGVLKLKLLSREDWARAWLASLPR